MESVVVCSIYAFHLFLLGARYSFPVLHVDFGQKLPKMFVLSIGYSVSHLEHLSVQNPSLARFVEQKNRELFEQKN